MFQGPWNWNALYINDRMMANVSDFEFQIDQITALDGYGFCLPDTELKLSVNIFCVDYILLK